MQRIVLFVWFVVVTVPTPATVRAETLKACEQEIEYKISDPASDLAPNLRAFSGVWVGKWKSFPFTHGAENPFCAGLIVERVDQDGTARTIYFRGSSWNQSMGINRPSKGAWIGKISGSVLHLPRDPKWVAREYIDFQLKSPTQLEGTFRGVQTGYFTKEPAAGTAATSNERQYLGDAEIRARVVGRAFTWSNGTKVDYRVNGTVIYANYDGQRGSGEFTVSNGKLCVKYDHNRPSRCFLYFSDANGLSVVIDSGETRRMTQDP